MRTFQWSVVITVTVVLLSRQAEAGYILTDLGTLGGTSSWAYALNDAGQITGRSLTTGGAGRAFLYSGGTMTQLATRGGDTYGFGINAHGVVSGMSTAAGSTYHAVVLSGTGLVDLAPGSAQSSNAIGINDAGLVTGEFGSQAYFYSGGTITQLGALSPFAGIEYSQGVAINNNAEIAGQSYTSAGQWRAFLYSEGVMQDLDTLGGADSRANALSDSGFVTGSARTTAGSLQAFLYDGVSMQGLGTLGGSFSEGYGINEIGQVVGQSATGTGAMHAFLYSDGQLFDLNALLPAGSGWTLQMARDINNVGQIIGWGIYNGQTRAFLLTPEDDVSPVPEPSTLALLGTGLLGLAGYRSRRRLSSPGHAHSPVRPESRRRH